MRDRGSTGGTQVDAGAGWLTVEDTIVKLGERLRFGDVEVGVSEIVAALSDGAGAGVEPARTFGRFCPSQDSR